MNRFDPSIVIAKKRDGFKLSKDEIKFFINGIMDGSVPDYQMSALLMAIYIRGLDKQETADLTDAMLYSGLLVEYKNPAIVIDKHSTGGIGDKTTFILAPIAAAAGVCVPSIAGRGLGFTGGTVDKIEAIKGFKTSVTMSEFHKLLDENQLVLMGATKDIAPADKIIYALRDVTATVSSISLITASIMSKKLAGGASGLVLDVKWGSGAFMKSKSDAKKLAKSLVSTALRFDKKCIAYLTDMNQPLGNAVGNTLEIVESLEILKGRGPKDLTDLSIQLAGTMIYFGGKAKSVADGVKKAKEVLANGKALEKFRAMVKAQGGDVKAVDDYSRMPSAPCSYEVLAPASGFVKKFENELIGHYCTELGGGRRVATDAIDFGVGFIFHKKVGDSVKKGESLLTIYHNPNQLELVEDMAKRFTKTVIKLSKTKVPAPALIHDIIKE